MKGTKMPSVMGGTWRWQRGLKIWRINTKLNILYIHGGSVPGPTHAYVRISDSCLPKNQERFKPDSHPPFPTFFPDDIKEPLPEELFDENLHQFKDPTIKFEGFQVKERKKRDGAKLAKIK
jgi:large subunit ribosomal protein L3